ncbi:hypothetical protein AMATHDRAFT_168326, partial [Amanita thiersii Skay4041]
TIRRRLPPRNVPGGLLNLRAFQSAAFSTYCFSGFLTFLGIYTVLTYIDIFATSVGVPADFSFYLVSITNAASIAGRYISGVLCDRMGPMNVMIPFTFLAGALTYAWPFASGTFASLISNPMMALGETGDVGRRLGMYMSIIALGAVAGPPVSGAILKATGGYEAMGFYAGTMVMLGVVFMIVARRCALGQWWGKF